jgi:hypothetical protein
MTIGRQIDRQTITSVDAFAADGRMATEHARNDLKPRATVRRLGCEQRSSRTSARNFARRRPQDPDPPQNG